MDETRALFDESFYRRTAGLPTETDAFAHYRREGAARGLKPNIVFEPAWYQARNPEAAASDPLQHYALAGEAADRDPSPLFDVAWYRRTYAQERPLAHYLAHRFGPFSPIPDFDAAFYLSAYPDVGAARLDPFQHYLLMGYREFRLPFAGFEPRLYALRRMSDARGDNPVAHMRAQGAGRVYEAAPKGGPFDAARRFTRRGPAFEAPAPFEGSPRALALAFHLPQFHAIPENDEWWGAGFTEWTALARGQPRFEGHYQPRIPGDLGFYDLGLPATLRAQAELARSAGIAAFVFYHYDFGGRRLLQRPVENLLATPDIDIGFCLMWANENWTRRWDGAEHEVLVAQDYSPAHEADRIAEFARHFRDARYLRLEGRPVLMVYRASLIPDTAATMARWRRAFDERHGEKPILVMAQTFDDVDPRPLGFDAAIEFPPHKLTRGLPQAFDALEVFDEGLEADIYAYDDVVDASLAEPYPAFPLIKTAAPSWDNDARRQGRGLTLAGATPAKFGRWLHELITRAAPVFGARIVAVNAWNEWSEGAYLEPDVFYGAACLNAAGRAIFGLTPAPLSFAYAAQSGAAARRLTQAFGLRGVAFASAEEAAASGLVNLPDVNQPDVAAFDADASARALFTLMLPSAAKVSAFLHIPAGATLAPSRLATLLGQTHPLWEIVVIDETGGEAALALIEAAAEAAGRDLVVFLDPPAQGRTPWRRVYEAASADFIWLMSPHGASDPTLVDRLAAPMQADARMALAFCDSGAVDDEGRRLFQRPSPLSLRTQGVVDRIYERGSNVQPVRSDAALWRRDALTDALRQLGDAPALDALVREIAAQPQSSIMHVADALDGVFQPGAVERNNGRWKP